MNGLGAVLAPRLIAEIGDVKRVYSRWALVAFAGPDASPYESGQFVGTREKYLSVVPRFGERQSTRS